MGISILRKTGYTIGILFIVWCLVVAGVRFSTDFASRDFCIGTNGYQQSHPNPERLSELTKDYPIWLGGQR